MIQQQTAPTQTLSLPNNEAYWGMYGGNPSQTGTIDAKLPQSPDDLQLIGEIKEEQFFEPLIIGDFVYTITNCRYLVKYDAQGNKMASVDLGTTLPSWNPIRMAYGDHKIYVPVQSSIYAFDLDTLSLLWKTTPVQSDAGTAYSLISGLLYYNGYVYTGATNAHWSGATDGMFVAVQTADEDTTQVEEKAFAWTMHAKTPNGHGFYWSEAVITDHSIVFADDSGHVVSHHFTQDIIYDEFDLPAASSLQKVRSNLVYLKEEQAIILGTQDSAMLHRINIKKDGTFDQTSLQSKVLQQGTTAIPISGGIAYHQGRLYVSSNDAQGAGLCVVDAKTLALLYATGVKTQSYPLLTTAYASDANQQQVIVYVMDYQGGLVAIQDAQGQTQPIVRKRSKDSFFSYNSNSVVADAQGRLYVYNGYDSKQGNRIFIYQGDDATYHADDIARTITQLAKKTLRYEDRSAILFTTERIQQLSKEEQAKIHNLAQFTTMQITMKQIIQQTIGTIQSRIDAISTQPTLDEQADLEQIWKEIGALSESDRNQIKDVKKLEQALQTTYTLASSIDALLKQIAAIDISTIDEQDLPRLKQLQSAYENLSQRDQAKVSNYAHLQAAMHKALLAQDLTLVTPLINDIKQLSAISSLTLKDEAMVDKLLARYASLLKEAQAKVTNAQILLNAQQELQLQRRMVDQLNQDIWEQLDPRNITLQDETKIKDFQARYASLSAINQTYVLYYDDVKQAETIVASLKQGILPSIVFDQIMGSEYTYRYEGHMNLLPYTIEIKGTDVHKPSDMNAQLSLTSPYDTMIRSIHPHALILHTKETGRFPGIMTITMPLQSSDGTYPLYEWKDEEIHRYGDAIIQNGFLTLTLQQGGTYFIDLPVKTIPNPPSATIDAIDTSDASNTNGYMILFLVSAGILGIGLYQRKKQ